VWAISPKGGGIANGTLALKAKVIADNSLSADFTVPAMLED